MAKDKDKVEEVEEEEIEMEPGDDVEEAQPSIEREGAPTGRSGGGGPNSAPASAGNIGGPI